jgi:predicted nucleotidyltransferase component of viral defense system
MQTVLQQMLSRYLTNTTEEKKNALKEILQEIVLCGLSRAGFFKKAAFYGGTALRIFYGLDRFSEDLDFSLIEPDNQFELKSYFSGVKAELSSLGLEFSIEEKEKTQASAIKSAFLKGNTKEHILRIYGSDLNINSNEVIKIKFEIDTNPPPFATFENRYRLLPSPYQVKLYDAESLFAGKLHAVICRSWKNRVKGRDLYDYVFYLAKNTSINFTHLKARLEESGAINPQAEFGINELKELLLERFDSIDFEQAKKDVLPFISDKSKIEIWSKEFFTDITTNLI